MASFGSSRSLCHPTHAQTRSQSRSQHLTPPTRTWPTNHRHRSLLPWSTQLLRHWPLSSLPSLPPPPHPLCLQPQPLPAAAPTRLVQHMSTAVHKPHPPQWTSPAMRRAARAVRTPAASGHISNHRLKGSTLRTSAQVQAAGRGSPRRTDTAWTDSDCADHVGRGTEGQ